MASADRERAGVIPQGIGRRPAAMALSFCGALALVVLLSNAVLARLALPDYATWTGISTLEIKLRLLTEYADAGPVDALVLGNSVADRGFSAEYYATIMTDHLGRPYRAFNFASAGADIVTLPKLYRLARTASTPRTILIVLLPLFQRPAVILGQPDDILARAPIHRTLHHPWLLPLDRLLWELPLLRFASPVRDRLLYGAYRNAGAGGGVYQTSKVGDRSGFGVESPYATILASRSELISQVSAPAPDTGNPQHAFNDAEIAALTELRALAAGDGAEIVVIDAAPTAAILEEPITDTVYRQASAAYFRTMAELLGSRRVDPLESFWTPRYAAGDTTHLNVHGSRMFTEQVTRVMGVNGSFDTALNRRDWPTPDLDVLSVGDVTFNTFTAVVLRETPAAGATLTLEIIQNQSTPPIPDAELFIALRLPDNRDQVARAERLPGDRLRATFPSLPAQSRLVMLARVLQEAGGRPVALSLPIGGYHWGSP